MAGRLDGVRTGLGAWQNECTAKPRGGSVEAHFDAMRRRIPVGRITTANGAAEAAALHCSDAAAAIRVEAPTVSGSEEHH